LLTDNEGYPITVEVFEGNTCDMQTVSSQIKKLSGRFGVKEVTLVGDRGMLKSVQIEELERYGFSYITAITKAQIEVLLKAGTLQMGLFDESVAEVRSEGIRYIMRRNPQRAREMQKSRTQRLEVLKEKAKALTEYLHNHPRASAEKGETRIRELCERLRLSSWIGLSLRERVLSVSVLEERLQEESRLDGCYVVTTKLSPEEISAQEIHDRYKDLSIVEQAFRRLKTGYLEIRPIYVRKERRTRAHVFVTMLGYLLIHEFWKRTQHLGYALHDMIDMLEKIQTVYVSVGGKTIKRVPEPDPESQAILQAIGIGLPGFINQG